MDFKLVILKILTAFREQDINYALLGGMAMGVWGVPRGTADIDFLVQREDMEKVDVIMKGLSYERLHQTENVSQYVSPLQIFGEVDFLHAFRVPSIRMLQRAEKKKMFGGTVGIKVLKVEDLIGFKLQAIANNESGRPLDLADIEALLRLHGGNVDWALIGEYFDLFRFDDLYKELKEKYGGNR